MPTQSQLYINAIRARHPAQLHNAPQSRFEIASSERLIIIKLSRTESGEFGRLIHVLETRSAREHTAGTYS